ncbi:MAG: rhomboid family intramembrane serine protease [Prevotella sp.]|nr:rhomboid family intramembrane serine protease [Prevotella sp.]
MRSIPTITKNLLIINILAFLAYYVLLFRGINLNDIFGLHFFLASHFHIYQLFTYMFMHGGWDHIFFNMFALWMFGCVMERVWGPKKFLFYYIFCGVGAGVIQEIAQYVELYSILSGQSGVGFTTLISSAWSDAALADSLNAWTTVGASGAIYAILLAFGMTFPNERIFIFPLPIPIKAMWFVMVYVAIELFSALGTSSDNVAHFAHLGGMLFGFLLIRYWQKHPESELYGRSHGRQFFDRWRANWENRKGKSYGAEEDVRHKTDWDYNADKKAQEEKIDKILDKIRKNGYGSLTEEEKRFLFESSNKK